MKLSQTIGSIMEEHNQNLPFSGAVYVRKDDEIYENAYGFANRSDRSPNTVNTRFGIASGCKIFTAVAITQLVQEGVITFDSNVTKLVDIPFARFDPKITVHHLLTHTSGIPDYFDEEVMDDFEELWKKIPMYYIRSPKDFLPLFQNRSMKFTPGERFSYCNSGFILLGLIVEQISGLNFTAYVEKNIFDRCGMTDSGYFRMDQLPERTALGYIDEGQNWRSNIYSVPIKGGPDGGAFTTVHDLAKFWDALVNKQLLSPEYTRVLLTPHVQEDENVSYGYGVWIGMRDNSIFKHFIMGSDPGVIMQSSVYAETGIHAHIIGNINKGAGMIARNIDEVIKG